MSGELHQILLDFLLFRYVPAPVFFIQLASDFFFDVALFKPINFLYDLGMLGLQGLVIRLFPLGLFVEFGDCLLVYNLNDTFVSVHFESVEDGLKMRIQHACAFVVVAGFCAALIVIEVLFLYDIAPHGLAAMPAGHKAFERYLCVFLDYPVSLCIFLEQTIDLQEHLL